MRIADLFVRVRGDTTDVPQKMKGVQTAIIAVGRSAEGNKLALNSMNSALSSLAAQATGTNPALATLSRVIGNFTLGGPMVAGALIGIAAIAKAYDLITSSARRAAEEQKKLADALTAQFAPKTGPRSATSKEFQAALQERADLTRKLVQLQNDRDNPLISNSFLGRKLYDNRIADVQAKIQALNDAIANAMTSSISSMQTVVTEGTKPLTSGFNELREAAAKVNAEAEKNEKDWWRGYIDRTNEALTLTQKLVAASGLMTVDVPKVDISADVKSAGDQAQKIIDAAEKNARMLQNAISNTAATIGSIVANAIGIIGSSRGNQIGGGIGAAIGSGFGSYLGQQAGTAVGGALGAAVGSVVPVVGTIVGGLIGSAIGGLFGHHERAVNANTQALQQNTAALLQNAPSIYKVARGRFDATEIKDFQRRQGLYASRGGAPVMVVP